MDWNPELLWTESKTAQVGRSSCIVKSCELCVKITVQTETFTLTPMGFIESPVDPTLEPIIASPTSKPKHQM